METTTFKTSLDSLAWVITIGITILFASIIGFQIVIITDHGKNGVIFTSITLSLIYFIAYGFSPGNYLVSKNEIIINRLFFKVHIPLKSIMHAEILDKKKIAWSLRTFGVGGLFGYFGKFLNYSQGSMTWYATRRDKVVLIQTVQNKKIILTPDDPELFLDALKLP